jgi:hypothetical protein
MRHRRTRSCAVLALQIHHHAWREEEGRASKHLHCKREEERPDHVVGIECAAGETACHVSDDEENPAISGMVRPAEEAWISEGGDLRKQISIRDVSMRRRGITYDRSSDHSRVELRKANSNGEADLPSLCKRQQSDDCEGPGARPLSRLIPRPRDECHDEKKQPLDEGRQDQPASFPRSDLVRKLSEYKTSNHEAEQDVLV